MNHKTEIRFHSTAAFVKNIEAAKRFYTETLEQVIELDFGKNVILKGGITLWEIDPDHIIPKKLGLGPVIDERINRFEFYFETEDIDGVIEKLKENGVEFLHLLHEEPWGQRTVRFFDLDRHLIEVGETLETFVKRLYEEGMTPEQVSEKTSVPLETVRELIN
ncbi:MAG: VOC family protein [Bacillota bacterium]